MADPKKSTTTLYNTGEGPRSVALADGSTRVIAAGDSAEVEVFSAELDALHPDLSEDAPKPAPARSTEPPAGSTNTDATADDQARRIEELATDLEKGHSLDELKAAAEADEVKVAKNATAPQIALAIAQKRLGANE